MKLPLSIFLLAACFLSLIAQKSEPVKIGYLIQDNTYVSARQGAELAVKTANEKGGLDGRPFQVIVKSMEGPWGTGSKQAVDLIFEDKVWALLGTHDGRNGHLVEQAATKSTTVFVSAWPSDPTLSYAFVPWFFNVVPTDLEQADMLINDIYNRNRSARIAVIADDSYEAKQSVKAFQRITDEKRHEKPVLLNFETYKDKPAVFISEIKKSGANCIVLFAGPLNSAAVVRAIKEQSLSLPLYASLNVLNENVLKAGQLNDMNNMLQIPSGLWSEVKIKQFRQAYFKTYGSYPGLSAAFAFDGMNVLIESIKKCKSSEREKIQEAITTFDSEGVTGRIAFDEHGNRKDLNVVCRVQNGLPVAFIK
ncbi:MAG TPA: ABC transporter substrate-binding protein [Bacteroidales bacterium]|nr:ABC transporter substrate-binding protein [Bacteroidales bacterium]